MFQLLKSLDLRSIMLRQLPQALFSIVIVERFFHLGSFTFECILFLSIWYATDFLFGIVKKYV
jgi:hypothetical protein